MSEFKFSCPACGQHISCSTAYCDQAIHCPNCRVQIRVPCSANSNMAREAPKLKLQSSVNHTVPETTNDSPKPLPTSAGEKELHCRCPVCQSHLRISALAATQSADDVFPEAELVLPPTATAHPPKPAAPPAEAATVMTEREKHIVAERAARDISLYPKMKPRLDLLLGEKSPDKSKDEENPPWMKEAA